MAETTRAALDRLDAMSEAWAIEADLPAMALNIAARRDAIDRQRGIEALVKQAFVEGAYRLFCKAQDDGVISSRPSPSAAARSASPA